jgi:integrase
MAKAVKDTALGKRSERSRLPNDSKPRWRSIHEGLHVGYRKSKRGGRWLARVYVPSKSGSPYVIRAIGAADDATDADGVQVYSWEQAQDRAREIATTVAAEATGQHVGPYTVADAMEDYHRDLERNGRATGPSRRRTELHILPVLGSIRLEDLTADTLRDWLKGVADHPGFNRRGEVRRRPKFDSPEDEAKYHRRRRDSANRILTILKAGLNHAFDEGKTASNAAWAGKRLQPFATTSRARDKYLSMDEVKRLVNAAEPGFRELVQGALYTGARYGDLAAMNVGDFNADRGLVMSSNGKAGRPHPVYLTDEGVAFFKRQTAGRPSDAPMFAHPDGNRRWRKSDQLRPMKKAAQAANVDVSFHGLRHTYASQLVMQNVPLLVVAQNLGHSDTRMVEEHYGHLADSYVRQSIRGSGLEWDITTDDNVVAL